MKKSLGIFAGVALCAAIAAKADPLLYWMVDQSDAENVIQYGYARVAYSDTDSTDAVAGYVDLITQDGSTVGAVASNPGATYNTAQMTWADLGSVSGYENKYFFVELLNWNSSSESFERMGQSVAKSYGDLNSFGSVLASSLNIGNLTSITAWAPGVNVPEPTSGLLMLIGGSLLALRRRRKVA